MVAMETETKSGAAPEVDKKNQRPWWTTVVVGLIVACALITVGWLARPDSKATVERASDREEVTHEYVIPDGTAARIESGEAVEIVPQRLEVHVGDTIRVRNEDSKASNVGIFYVGAGETVTMRFSTPGTVKGACDIHPSGEFVIDVLA